MKDFEKKFEQLRPDQQIKIIIYMDLMLNKPKKKKLDFSWEGALKEYKDKYTSVELQKKALDWF